MEYRHDLGLEEMLRGGLRFVASIGTRHVLFQRVHVV